MLRGVHVTADGDRLLVDAGRPLTDPERTYVRDHKPELLVKARRRDEALVLLADSPRKCAYLVTPGDPVIITVAIRDLMPGSDVTCELQVAPDRYDMAKMLALMDGEMEPSNDP